MELPFDSSVGLFWLLLPVAALSGWYIARYRDSNGRQSVHRSLPATYFKGLNYLLSEQPDKAIEVFIKMIEVEGELVETHLALGNLFRRRGEVERAIRLHQHLIRKATLTEEQRGVAMLELGFDYMRSGLLDRAETLFKDLLAEKRHNRQALKQLVEIYQLEQDWPQAIAYARELAEHYDEDVSSLLAHFYCEEAEQHLRTHDTEAALNLLKQALQADRNCVRASLMEGRIAQQHQKLPEAIKAYLRIEKQDSDFLVEAMQPLLECHRAAGTLDEFHNYVQTVARKYPAIRTHYILADLIAEQEGNYEALNYIRQELQQQASWHGLSRLVEYTALTTAESTREPIEHIRTVMGTLLADKHAYKCKRCGFLGKRLYWQCPGCKSWSTIRPLPGHEGE